MDFTKRVKEERNTLKKLMLQGNSGDQYAFDAKWIEIYQDYVYCRKGTSTEKPPVIDNRPIEEKIRRNCLKTDDFYTVNENIARLLYLLYGGGPIITLKNIEELKRDQELTKQSCLLSPSKPHSTYCKEPETDLKSSGTSGYSLETNLSASYSRPIKTKSSIERRYGNAEGWVTHSKGNLEDSSSMYSCKHRGDSPVAPMDEEEMSIKQRLSKSQVAKLTSVLNSEHGTTHSTTDKDTAKALSTAASTDKYKLMLLQFIEKSKIQGKSNSIDFQREAKLQIHKKVVEMLTDPANHSDPLQEDPLESKYGHLSKHQLEQKCNAFENTHVYCYLNSLLQMLFTINELMAYFTKVSEESFRGKSTLDEFRKITQEYQSSDHKLLDAISFLKCFKSKIDVDKQQDADELLRILLDQIHKELKIPSKQKNLSAYQNPKLTWQAFCQKEDSFITYLFTGETKRKTVCLNCMHDSEVRETFDILSLSISKDNTTLSQVLDSNFDPELIESGYQCSNCKKNAPATSKIFFTKLPKFLIIQLKRFLMFPKACKNDQAIKYDDNDRLALKK
jgi:ubiquitin C-terminal hydrolase